MRFCLTTIRLAIILCLLGGVMLSAEPPKPLTATGLITPYREVEVASSTDGVIMKVLVREGDSVAEGQVIAELDAKREQWEADYTKFTKEKRDADLESAQKLMEKEAISKDEYREKQVEARLAETQWHISQQRLEDKTIRAPFAGLVVRKFKEVGEAIHGLERFVQVVNIDKVYVIAYFDGSEITRVKRGQQAKVTVPTCGEEVFLGTVEIVDPVIDPSSGLFRVKISVENAHRRIPSGAKGQLVLIEELPHAAAQ